MSQHCGDVNRDRKVGEVWEKNFCRLVSVYRGGLVTPQQLRCKDGGAVAYDAGDGWKQLLLPDITIWASPGEHHEIKHKNPTRTGCYGLELYRLEALHRFATETKSNVMYTIHDWSLAGATRSGDRTANNINDWRTVPVEVLYATPRVTSSRGKSYCAGRCITTSICYWPTRLWRPLLEWWRGIASFQASA